MFPRALGTAGMELLYKTLLLFAICEIAGTLKIFTVSTQTRSLFPFTFDTQTYRNGRSDHPAASMELRTVTRS